MNGETSAFPEWGDNAEPNNHLWVSVSSSDHCYYQQCHGEGGRVRCTACRAVCHRGCARSYSDVAGCKPTFRCSAPRNYREKTVVFHHWLPRKTHSGKCSNCLKSLQSKLFAKEWAIMSCSWCKMAFHNKSSCFNRDFLETQECDMGSHRNIIVPPSWIVKLEVKKDFKSSLPRRNNIPEELNSPTENTGLFSVKPIPSTTMRPLIVFINPKSGGNQGVKLLQKFQWLLNPRQVFDLTKGGPRMGLELFSKVPNLRVLACGGDGTVGWVLSEIDRMKFLNAPSVAVLPLGTGNDLARSLNWGGGYTDEPISKILSDVGDSEVSRLDRWRIEVSPNPDGNCNGDGKDNLPLNVLNNYFSLGVDAHIALEFHEAREAHPEKFNSRLRNKMFYGQMGGKDLLVRKWKGLSDCMYLTCDDQDYTAKLREHRVHAIVLLNICSYGGGTRPWPRGGGNIDPSTEDGYIEVIGLTTYQLPLLQAGGHGTCICQCKRVRIVTEKVIPMQVDGEACRLKPSVIDISLLNTVPMLAKRKRGRFNSDVTFKDVELAINKIKFQDYENYYFDKEMLKSLSINIGQVKLSPISTLETVRATINDLVKSSDSSRRPASEWYFADSCTAERFFRIDQGQESNYYVTDIADQVIYVVDPECMAQQECVGGMPQRSKEMNYGYGSDMGSKKVQNRPDSPVARSPINSQMNSMGEMNKFTPKGRYVFKNFEDSIDEYPRHRNVSSPDEIMNYFSHHNNDVGRNLFGSEIYRYNNLLERNSEDLVKAAKHGDLEKLKTLHKKGYSLLSIDQDGYTALHYSSLNGDKEMVKYLLAKAPNNLIHMKDKRKGRCAIHEAAAKGHLAVSSALVAAGAPITSTDNQGNTPRDIATKSKHPLLAAYFEDMEACKKF